MVSVIGGCASTDAKPEAPEALDGPVEYQRSSFQAGVHTTMYIEPDGTVTRIVTPGPAETATLDSAAIDDLARNIDDAQFSTLERKYGCGSCADHPVHWITVRIDGALYTVRADSNSDFPERLRPLIDALRDISERSFD